MKRWRYERIKITDRAGIPVGETAFLRENGKVSIENRTHNQLCEINDKTNDRIFKRPQNGRLLTVQNHESRVLFEFREKKYAASYWVCWTLTEEALSAPAKPYHETPEITWKHFLYWRDLLAETGCEFLLLIEFLLIIAWLMSIVGAILS